MAQGGARVPPAATLGVALEDVRLPHRQPRRYFDPEAMSRLKESVRRHGILQPLLVRPLDAGSYELVAGERRYRAAKDTGLGEIPVVIREMSDEEAVQYALLENLQREDLNPVEETEGILQLLALGLGESVEEVTSLLYRMHNAARQATKRGATHNVMGSAAEEAVAELFDGLGTMTWESFVQNRLPLLNLPPDVLDALRSGSIAYTKARLVARVRDQEQRRAILREAVEQHLSVSELRRRVTSLLVDKGNPSPGATTLSGRTSNLARRLGRRGALEDEDKRRRFEALLAELEALVEE